MVELLPSFYLQSLSLFVYPNLSKPGGWGRWLVAEWGRCPSTQRPLAGWGAACGGWNMKLVIIVESEWLFTFSYCESNQTDWFFSFLYAVFKGKFPMIKSHCSMSSPHCSRLDLQPKGCCQREGVDLLKERALHDQPALNHVKVQVDVWRGTGKCLTQSNVVAKTRM